MICPTCNEDYMACDRYGCWKDWAVLSNTQNKPKYSLAVTYLIGAVILVCMGTGIYLGVRYGY